MVTTATGVAESFKQFQGQPLDKYIWLRNLFVEKEYEYYSLLLNKTEDVLPFIYTPTVGEACQKYHRLPLKTVGLYLTLEDKGKILEKLKRWHRQTIQVVVVTDGERILGLGDLGANGMGISEGKITLYTAAAGVDPTHCLPVCVDMGTNNKELLEDPQYHGLKRQRAGTQEFDQFMEEFMEAIKSWQPHVLVQFEDFANANAFRLLKRFQGTHCCFNDDIQGTASICLSAIMAGLRATGSHLEQQRIMFLGAGEAGTGIAELIAYFLQQRSGMSLTDARKLCFFLDSKGLVCKERTDLQEHKQPFAHDVRFCKDLKSAVKAIKPSVLIGVSTVPHSFDEDVIKLMCEYNERPIIMPLSNPTSKSECTFEDAYRWSNGKVIFASGSPFDPIKTPEGHTVYPAQANNAYIFPAVGHAAVLTQCFSLRDEAFLVAAEKLANIMDLEDIKQGRLFPNFSRIKDASARVMAPVCEYMVSAGLGLRPSECKDLQSWEAYARSKMWGASHHKL